MRRHPLRSVLLCALLSAGCTSVVGGTGSSAPPGPDGGAPDPGGPAGLRAFITSAQASYDLLHGFAFDCGGRVAWQEFAGGVVVYPTEVVFVGLSYAHQFPL